MPVSLLSCDDGEAITENDLLEGSQLLMDHNKKSWPVTVIKESNGQLHDYILTMNEYTYV